MYLSLKSLHIISLISWMAGILYLYRLFVYHKEKSNGEGAIHDLLHLMEYRLFYYITLPAMALTWITGFWMLKINSFWFSQPWVHAKLGLVVLLTISTKYAGLLIRVFSIRFDKAPSGRTLRILNEVPTVLMIGIVVLVTFKFSL